MKFVIVVMRRGKTYQLKKFIYNSDDHTGTHKTATTARYNA